MESAALIRLDHARNGNFEFADAADVARKLAQEAPVFCFSPAALRTRFDTVHKTFPGQVSYAVKANSQPHVLATLAKSGCAIWDVASVEEMSAVRTESPGAKFHYHNPVKSRAEIQQAYVRFGCRRFAVDCQEELDKITAVLGCGHEIEIAVRFVLARDAAASAHDFSSKFGAAERDAAQLLAEAAGRGYRGVLTFHPGSQCKSPGAYGRHIEAAHRIALAARVDIAALNVGGGFPASYPGSAAPPLGEYFSTIGDTALRVFGPNRPKLECEPGRCMVAETHALLARVKLARPGRNELFLNDGIYGALLECAQVPELMPAVRAIRAGKLLDGDMVGYTVYGPTCDPLDVLPGKACLPAGIQEGDFLEFGSLGAYGAATATRFNGYGTHSTVHVERVFSTSC